MLNFWKKDSKKDENQPESSQRLTWDEKARGALEQALAQAPVPKMMRGQMKKQLKSAAEEVTRKAGRTTVTAEDLMQGFMDKLPAGMREQVEDAAKKGPEGLKDLEKKLKRR